MKPSARIFLLLVCSVLFQAGCGSVRMDANATDFPIARDVVPAYKPGQMIAAINDYDKPEIIKLYGDRLYADLKQYTDTAIKLLRQGLQHRQIRIRPDAGKSVKLRVHSVRYEPAFWTTRADVNITAELGNGKHFTVFHHNASPLSGWRAVSGAITRATEKILQHPMFIRYLNE